MKEMALRYGATAGGSVTDHSLLRTVTPKEATQDLLAQTTKLSCALTSGVFAGPVPESATAIDANSNDPRYRLQPRMFKLVIGGDHVEFRGGQQQDAAQFLQYMLDKLDRAEKAAFVSKRLKKSGDENYVSSHLFAFKTMDRLVCSTDGRVKYTESASETMLSLPVPMEKAINVLETDAPDQKRHKVEGKLQEKEEQNNVPTINFQTCLNSWAADITIEDYRWPHLNNSIASATCQTRFANFPRYLIVHIQRYALGTDWTPRKLEVNLEIPEEIDFSALKFKGPQEGEELASEKGENSSSGFQSNMTPPINESSLAQLMDMGFSLNGCKRALIAVGGSDTDAAINWLFEHNMDIDFDDPPLEPCVTPAAVGDDSVIDEGVVVSLVENLGCFTMDQVRAALKETCGAADRAADWLFSHMDDLDGAIAALHSKETSTSTSSSAPPLDDGEGKYAMVGMVSHIGIHTGSGHYVAHLKRGEKWIIFNDEKVAISESPPFAHAYIYLFQRKDTVGSPNPHY